MYTRIIILVIMLNAFPVELASLTCCTLYLKFLDASKMEAVRRLDNQLCTLFGECDICVIVYVI